MYFDIDNYITCVCNLLLVTGKWVIRKEKHLIKYQQKIDSVQRVKVYMIDNLKYSEKCEKLMLKC